MKFILPVAVLSIILLSSSCGKQDYTCVCQDLNGGADKRYDMADRVQSKAVEECNIHETELNKSGSSYDCKLQ